jgi:hypothetical protein
MNIAWWHRFSAPTGTTGTAATGRRRPVPDLLCPRAPGPADGGMTGAIGGAVMAASPWGETATSRQPAGGGFASASRLCVRAVPVLGEISPVWVSEGGLEPPCPFGALAPQASASAYSATRTSARHG